MHGYSRKPQLLLITLLSVFKDTVHYQLWKHKLHQDSHTFNLIFNHIFMAIHDNRDRYPPSIDGSSFFLRGPSCSAFLEA